MLDAEDSHALSVSPSLQSNKSQPECSFAQKLHCSRMTRTHSCPPHDIRFENLCVDVKVFKDVSKEVEKLKPTRGLFWTCYHRTFGALFTKLGLASLSSVTFDKRRILFNVSGKFQAGELTAVMGASGAGKSTLLSVLSGKRHPIEGRIWINDQEARRENFQTSSAFVHQQDVFLDNLTPSEHLETQLALRLPEAARNKVLRAQRLEILINDMSLAKCRDQTIGTGFSPGGLSGGERKRLNISSEITCFPSIIYLDEPTTGLDSSLALSVVVSLRRLADSGHTVVATIHQPSSKIFVMFDKVVLLAEGRIVYAGDRLGCLEWFRSAHQLSCPPFTNPADFLIKVSLFLVAVTEPPGTILVVLGIPFSGEASAAKRKTILSWADRWNRDGAAFLESWAASERHIEKNPPFNVYASSTMSCVDHVSTKAANASSLKPIADLFPPSQSTSLTTPCFTVDIPPDEAFKYPSGPLSWWLQVTILYRRALLQGKRSGILVFARLGQTVVLSLFYGFLLFRLDWSIGGSFARIGGLYTLFINQCMAGAFTVSHVFVAEKPVIEREYSTGFLSPSAHMVAKMLADVMVQLFFPVLFVTVGYWLMGLNDNFGRYCIVMALVWLVSNTAMAVGYLASGIASSAETASVICNLTILPLTIFGGFMVRIPESSKWLSWIQHISFLKYGFIHGAYTIFDDHNIIATPTEPATSNALAHHFISGHQFVELRLGVPRTSWVFTFGMLFLLFIIYRTLAALACSLTLRRRTRKNEVY